MNDEFRMTPVDVRAQEFRRSAFGYERAIVEDFRERVATELERLLKERSTLEERVQGLREQLKVFREREKALNDALVAAQQLRNDTEAVARQQADVILREARLKADQVLAEARESERQVRSDAESAQRHFAGYLAAYRSLLERSLAEVDALEAHQRDGSPPPPRA
ncbi:MAG TPA: DivIVA domain-containing protein [Gemmatimonadales bacterium]|nr:DivIVA domain-containing protein [Gemmatimonadales bacterium]